MIKEIFPVLLLTTCISFAGMAWMASSQGRGVAPKRAAKVPSKTVVLTFDDAVKSHVTVVAPLLKELGFHATFFITHAWMNDTEDFLSWEDVVAIHRMGFEIGKPNSRNRGCGKKKQPAGVRFLPAVESDE